MVLIIIKASIERDTVIFGGVERSFAIWNFEWQANQGIPIVANLRIKTEWIQCTFKVVLWTETRPNSKMFIHMLAC
jgi:hypothetical protein